VESLKNSIVNYNGPIFDLFFFACDSLMTYGHIDCLMTIVLAVNYYDHSGAIKWKIFLVVF